MPPITADKTVPQQDQGLSEVNPKEVENWNKKTIPKKIIKKYEHVKGEYISTTFVRPKPDSSNRPILNLKKLNREMPYTHF